MLKKLLVLDGVTAVCRFQDDGSMIESAGMLPQPLLERLAQFAHWYRRMIASNTDLLALFSQSNGWTPSRGWMVRGHEATVCSVGNLACLVENNEASLNEIMQTLETVAHE